MPLLGDSRAMVKGETNGAGSEGQCNTKPSHLKTDNKGKKVQPISL